MEGASFAKYLESRCKIVPDFPKPGIPFRDIFPMFKNPSDIKALVAEIVKVAKTVANGRKIDVIVGLDARGFLLGPMIAVELGAAFAPVRKKGKLPGKTISVSYELEYRSDTAEMQSDSIEKGQNIILFDDLLATGGSLDAACQLVKQMGGEILASLVIIELSYLNGRKLAEKHGPVHAILDIKSP